ncbi:MAG TPA: hypothetical protein DIW46_08375 [Microbacterium sp.]|nr:hypothetical protein [Microbacterium sp.]
MNNDERTQASRRLSAALAYNDRGQKAARVALAAIDAGASSAVLAARLRTSGTCTAGEADRIAAALDGSKS